MSCCLSPIEYFIEYADSQKQSNPGITMSDILLDGVIFPNSINICCHDFSTDAYFLVGKGSQELIDYIDVVEVTFSSSGGCANQYFLFSNYKTFIEDYLITNDPFIDVIQSVRRCCNNNNNLTCLNELIEHTNSTALKEWFYIPGTSNGLFEYGFINGKFAFCEIVNLLKTKSPAIAEEYILAILEHGLVVSCKPEGIYVGSLAKYLELYYITP